MSYADPYNAFLLSDPKFGLTIDELHADLLPELTAHNMAFEISFLPSGDIILRVLSGGSWHGKTEPTLISLKPGITKKVKALNLSSAVALCAVDTNLNVIRREDDHAGGGWSQVAKGGLGGRAVEKEGLGKKSSFTVLRSKSVLRKKKVVEEEAVDDWEKEAEAMDG
jgi:transcriptional repressor NF-X1